MHNKFERQVGFTYHGDPGKVAGLTFETKSFGPWDGKYIVKQAKHTVTGSGGYTTQVSGRHVFRRVLMNTAVDVRLGKVTDVNKEKAPLSAANLRTPASRPAGSR